MSPSAHSLEFELCPLKHTPSNALGDLCSRIAPWHARDGGARSATDLANQTTLRSQVAMLSIQAPSQI